MNCERIDALLDEQKADSLSPAQRAAVEVHLEHCTRCADAWFVHHALAAEELPAPPSGLLLATLRRAARPAAATRPRASARWISVAGVAAVVALVAIALFDIDPARNGSAPALRTAIEPSRFMAGVHYERIPEENRIGVGANGPDVIEFFMYGCFPCYSFEPALAQWETTLPSDVRFERVPALFNPLARLHAQVFYTAEALGKTDELHGAFFEEIHRNGNRLDSASALTALFASFGVERETFVRTFESQAVAQALERAADLNRLYQPPATPALVIDGAYVTTPGMVRSFPMMLEVASELLAERARSCIDRGACDRR